MNTSQYWLFDWLDRYGVSDLHKAKKLLSNEAARDVMRSLAKQSAANDRHARPLNSILAGRGIDLSGHLDCNGASCRRRQVEELFRRVWHYFDKIVVADAIGHEVAWHWTEPSEQFTEWVLSHIAVLLYVREIGAESLLEFKEKPGPCEKHWRQHAEEAGLVRLLQTADDTIPALVDEGKWHFTPAEGGSVDFVFNHPAFEHTQWGHLSALEAASKDLESLKLAGSEVVVRRFVAHLTSDASAAKSAGLPLGSTIFLYRRLMQQPQASSVEQVAFELQLPILDNLPIEVLIKVRLDEHEYFQRFQLRLRQAMEERQRIDAAASPENIARQIRLDLIEPELRRLRDRLKASERALNKKAAVGLTLGALATTCGVISGLPIPLSLGAGTGAVITMTAAAAAKHIEEVRDVSLEDFYFLWKASEHVH